MQKCDTQKLSLIFQGKCLDLTCEEEYNLDQSLECRPKFFEWRENNYELSMIFKPSRQVEKQTLDELAPHLMNILKNKVTRNNLSEYLCVIHVFGLDENNEWYFGALIGFIINKRHDIDKMIENLIHIFEKDSALTFLDYVHGYNMKVSSSIQGQRFHLRKNNEHFIYSPCHQYLNPTTFTQIFPLSSLEYENSFLCSEVSSTIVVADWYRCLKVKISTEDTKIRLINNSLCLLDYDHCIPSRFFKKDYSSQQFEVCLDWYKRATNRMSAQKRISDNDVNIYLSVVCLSLSSCGSLFTIISYLVQKDPINSAGANIIILSLFLIIANTIYTFSNFFLQTKLLCIAAGVLIHFSWLSVVFWMSLSSFQVFHTFTKITVPTLKGKSNVLCFLLFNTLLCLLMIGVNVIISYSFSEGQSLGYSPRTCYIAESNMILYTFAVPVGITVCINTFMFVVTVSRIHKKGDMRKSRDQNRVGAYFRLSTLTGMSWVFGFLAKFTDLQVFSILHIVFSAGQGIFLYLGFGMPLGIKWKYARNS
ncbi:uncharacterized protein LOC133175706 [Saccostrea echinata]|uniref:uncharacterized protein LOC133175706 n=1 Tax=Saccostrea echinata TaxID=191078 RepID=UPI002A7EFE14|nr:uncharacterized protein LOC133175706 [Saccostrea echinata]